MESYIVKTRYVCASCTWQSTARRMEYTCTRCLAEICGSCAEEHVCDATTTT